MTINYNMYVQRAMRTIIRDILSDAMENGLQGESHFFITFQTDREDVKLPPYVCAKYPQQMSIILQHQYENLNVGLDGFSVELAFGGVPATIYVPYTAIIQFADPSCEFGLVLEPERLETVQTAHKIETVTTAEVIDLEALRKK
ncbi:MAG: stringent starvation protein B [Alphaproteobacteria bacterium]|nr:stringent starvation protein B [Alphaproteobacteria bacterium]